MKLRPMSEMRKVLLVSLLAVSVGLVIVSLFAPYLGLGRNADYVLYKLFFLNRRESLVVGIILFLLFLLVHLVGPSYTAARTAPRSRWFAWFLGLLAVLAAIKVFDNFIEETIIDRPAMYANGGNGLAHRVYPYTGWHLVPGLHRADHVDIRVGEHGFRTALDVDSPPPSAARRLLLLGDGLAQGLASPEDPASLLEAALRDNSVRAIADIEAVNLAMHAGNADQSAAIVRRWGREVAPQIVVLFCGPNELRVALATGTDAPPGWSSQTILAGSPGNPDTGSLDWLSEILPSTAGVLRATVAGQFIAPDNAEAEARYRRDFNLEGIAAVDIAVRQILRAAGGIRRDLPAARIILALPPGGQGLDAESYRALRARLLDAAGTGGFQVIDLAETFDRPSFGEPGYFGRPEDLAKLMLPIAEFIAATDGKDGS
ncbi:MAG: hypothetical protein RJQ21_00670 [Rhodospirillales bacterium]